MTSDPAVPAVTLIEDDDDVRESLRGLFRSVGLTVRAYASVKEFDESGLRGRRGCFVLDVRLPGKSGLEFQEELAGTSDERPIIFISGHADVAMSVRAMKAGAVEFLTKPVRDQDLLEAVHLALEHDRKRHEHERSLDAISADYAQLTPRERDIMARIATGRRNKEIARDIGVSEATVKIHRASIMHKMGANSAIELARMSDALARRRGLPPPKG